MYTYEFMLTYVYVYTLVPNAQTTQTSSKCKAKDQKAKEAVNKLIEWNDEIEREWVNAYVCECVCPYATNSWQ